MTRLTRHQLGWRFVETTFVPLRRKHERHVYKQKDRELTYLIQWMVLQQFSSPAV